MSRNDKNYDPFAIFEEIVSQAEAATEEVRRTSEKIIREVAEDAEKAAGEMTAALREQTATLRRQAREVQEQVRTMGEEWKDAWEQDSGRQTKASKGADEYYEIEYDSSPISGAGKFVLKSQKIEERERDEVRELFDQMRNIARENRSLLHNSSQFYNFRVQQEKAKIFYKQGMFMKDFEDDYEIVAPYNSYFPYYQTMGYDQLRTYFTWRTKVRRGIVENISLSYAYLYMYELLNNIGVEEPWEGLEELMYFWREFRTYNDSIDKYMLKWLKDYHIYYEMEESFQEFVYRYNLVEYYPYLWDSEEEFDLYCAVSKYDIRKSKFYTNENRQKIRECFNFTISRLKEVLADADTSLEEAIFQPTKNMVLWQPFKDALFHPWLCQRDRQVVISEKEIYLCTQNRWTHRTTLTTESGKQLVGYILKQMEVALRKAMNYKYKLSANPKDVNPILIARLENKGMTLEGIINAAVEEFYREATKTVVKVDFDSLAKIRQEAMQTQEKLIVEDEADLALGKAGFGTGAEREAEAGSGTGAEYGAEAGSGTGAEREAEAEHMAGVDTEPDRPAQFATGQLGIREECLGIEKSAQGKLHEEEDTSWSVLQSALSAIEIEALRLALNDIGNLKQFADEQGIMLEVLMDGINEKAQDCMGDSLFDEEFILYEDYIEEVRRMVEI